MDRRNFLRLGLASGVAGGLAGVAGFRPAPLSVGDSWGPCPPSYGIIPVVGDGKWIWTEPPEDQTGYLEPRSYELKVGIQLQGTGTAQNLQATTPVPVELPEQHLERADIETQGCSARFRQLTREAAQMLLTAPAIVRGQTIAAAAHFRLLLHKSYHAYAAEQFPAQQQYHPQLRKKYMYDSPGIQTRFEEVRDLAQKVGGGIEHPWDRAKAFYTWVWENIEGRPQPYTSVITAIRKRIGDCEERAATFAGLCRASGILARLVWVPNHNWAEFYLQDHEGEGHWIPAHTSAYSWFGWTGAHELVIQKGDSISVPEQRKPLRLLADWMRWQGSRPKVRYLAELSPLPTASGDDSGPGARRKDAKGEWLRIGSHPLDAYMRDGTRSTQTPPPSLTRR